MEAVAVIDAVLVAVLVADAVWLGVLGTDGVTEAVPDFDAVWLGVLDAVPVFVTDREAVLETLANNRRPLT